MPKGTKISAEICREVIATVDGGLSYRKVAVRFGISSTSVNRICKRAAAEPELLGGKEIALLAAELTLTPENG
jgi:transposase